MTAEPTGHAMWVPSPTFGHQNIAGLLWYWLRQNAPEKAPSEIRLPIRDITP